MFDIISLSLGGPWVSSGVPPRHKHTISHLFYHLVKCIHRLSAFHNMLSQVT